MKYYNKQLRQTAIKETLNLMEEIEKESFPGGLNKLIIYYLYYFVMKSQGHIRALYYVYMLGKKEGKKNEQKNKEWNKFALFNNVKNFILNSDNEDLSYQVFKKWFEEETGYHYE